MDHDKALLAWLRDQRRRNLSEGTIEKRESVARRCSTHAGRPMLELTREHIEAWLDSRRTVTPRTRYAYISHLAAFFTWAIREDLAVHDPTVKITRPKVHVGLPRPIATGDLRTAIDAAPTVELRAMLKLAAYEGMRCHEIAQMQAADVLDTHDPPLVLIHGKGGKERLVPLHPDALAELRCHGIPNRGHVFGPYPAWKVSHMIRAHLHDCDVRASAHQLRHWFGTSTYEQSGGDLRMVQDLLGHSSPATTAIYTKWSRAKASVVVARLSA